MRYAIEGDNLPVAICTLQDGERMLTEKGAMSWMTPNIEMSTSMEGGLGKAFGRAFSGESMFMNYYTCRGGEGMIAFASSLSTPRTASSFRNPLFWRRKSGCS